jgi:hypothetical protein
MSFFDWLKFPKITFYWWFLNFNYFQIFYKNKIHFKKKCKPQLKTFNDWMLMIKFVIFTILLFVHTSTSTPYISSFFSWSKAPKYFFSQLYDVSDLTGKLKNIFMKKESMITLSLGVLVTLTVINTTTFLLFKETMSTFTCGLEIIGNLEN